MNSDLSSPVHEVPFSAHQNVLFLDFDGTLAPLQDDPDTVSLPDYGAETLLKLKQLPLQQLTYSRTKRPTFQWIH